MRFWLLGVPDPGTAFELKRNAQDRAEQLSQAGWSIDYDRYMPIDGDLLPAHLVLSREDVRVRIVIDHWDWTVSEPLTPRRWPAPAKLNLFLHIVGTAARRLSRTADLFSVRRFVRRDRYRACAPTAQIRRTAEIAGVRRGADLCVRAAGAAGRGGLLTGRRHRRAQAHPHGRRFGRRQFRCGHLFGGAQSFVGTRTGRSDDLAALGLKLGADVPVFVHGRAAWAEGVGERLTPLVSAAGPARD